MIKLALLLTKVRNKTLDYGMHILDTRAQSCGVENGLVPRAAYGNAHIIKKVGPIAYISKTDLNTDLFTPA